MQAMHTLKKGQYMNTLRIWGQVQHICKRALEQEEPRGIPLLLIERGMRDLLQMGALQHSNL